MKVYKEIMGKVGYRSDQLFELIKELSKNGVNFVVCGGIACVLHGIERTTYDLDLSVDLDAENLKKVIKIAGKFDLKPRIPEPVENLLDEKKRREWVDKKGALVYTFTSSTGPLQLDIFLKYLKPHKDLLKNSNKMKIENLEIYVTSKEDLLAAKKLITPLRDKDVIDINELEIMIKKEKESGS